MHFAIVGHWDDAGQVGRLRVTVSDHLGSETLRACTVSAWTMRSEFERCVRDLVDELEMASWPSQDPLF